MPGAPSFPPSPNSTPQGEKGGNVEQEQPAPQVPAAVAEALGRITARKASSKPESLRVEHHGSVPGTEEPPLLPETPEEWKVLGSYANPGHSEPDPSWIPAAQMPDTRTRSSGSSEGELTPPMPNQVKETPVRVVRDPKTGKASWEIIGDDN